MRPITPPKISPSDDLLIFLSKLFAALFQSSASLGSMIKVKVPVNSVKNTGTAYFAAATTLELASGTDAVASKNITVPKQKPIRPPATVANTLINFFPILHSLVFYYFLNTAADTILSASSSTTPLTRIISLVRICLAFCSIFLSPVDSPFRFSERIRFRTTSAT